MVRQRSSLSKFLGEDCVWFAAQRDTCSLTELRRQRQLRCGFGTYNRPDILAQLMKFGGGNGTLNSSLLDPHQDPLESCRGKPWQW